jgi:hypothetical protein
MIEGNSTPRRKILKRQAAQNSTSEAPKKTKTTALARTKSTAQAPITPSTRASKRAAKKNLSTETVADSDFKDETEE